MVFFFLLSSLSICIILKTKKIQNSKLKKVSCQWKLERKESTPLHGPSFLYLGRFPSKTHLSTYMVKCDSSRASFQVDKVDTENATHMTQALYIVAVR